MHDFVGGAAHSFEVAGYKFDAGPSFHMGLADPPGMSSNPLKQVLDALGESVQCERYSQVSIYLRVTQQRLGQGLGWGRVKGRGTVSVW